MFEDFKEQVKGSTKKFIFEQMPTYSVEHRYVLRVSTLSYLGGNLKVKVISLMEAKNNLNF